MFNSDVELGKFVGSTDLIPDAYRAITETSSTCQLHTTRSGIKVLAFSSFPDYTFRFHNREFDLVSSEHHEMFDFISTKVNPKFSINGAGVELFEQHFAKLLELLNQLIDSPLVITGQGIGGYLAILFALRHQHEVDVQESNGSKSAKRPICITFGCPMLGNEHLQGAIAERPQWKSSFLNVVAKTDPLASFFSSNSPYKPFGTFLFCTESGGHAAFEDQDAILAALDAMVSSNAGNSQMHDYSKELGSIRKKVLYRGPSEFSESNVTPLRAGIVFQFQEIGVLNDISNDLITEMEKKQVKIIKSKKRYEPTKKLNDMKINLTYMEWYMKTRRLKGGYYDIYKNVSDTDKVENKDVIIKPQRFLDQYWKKTVDESDLMPQKQGAKLRKRWLYNGTNYRRIMEPLDIADYYKSGRKNYIANRPKHYELLEKWSEDEKKERKPSEVRMKAASLTEDSCFWAHVEEAFISLRGLKNGDLSCNTTDIGKFEAYLLGAINEKSLSPDVFVEGSSLMKWWSEYYAYKGSSCNPELARFMNNGSYKSYE
ncbi:senescence-associated carboxylesterase 101 [Lactuca sativa]|uniref:senescence-associated carboxylesterase 101 n=1 Tax=Lactuca sativa TaxID=4236 RepID=UPI000CD9D72A|nr:senescence-associated carboxylesterase 101 [Lactuca sativa]